MSKYKDKAALHKMVQARTNLLVSNGFFGSLALHLQLVEIEDGKIHGMPCETMAVDGKHLYYHPQFVHDITERQTEAVICHEVEHCAFQHFSRRGDRDPRLWNVAGDFVINLDLHEAGFDLPHKPIGLKELINFDPKRDDPKAKSHLYDPQFKGMNTEAIYDILMKHAKKIEVLCVGGEGDPGGMGGVMDAPGDAGDQGQTSSDWEGAVRMAVEAARANGVGNLPGSLQKLLNNLKKPKVSWREKTRRFIDASMLKEVSWARLSRRSVSAGVLMPGYVSDRLRKLVFFVDTSGSISHEMAVQMVSEVAGALDEGTADCVVVAYADTQVQHSDEYMQGDLVECGKYSGGGTDFADSFRWLKEQHPDASAVIYLTDLEVYNFGEEPPCPTLWAVYQPSDDRFAHVAANAPFGEAIHIDNMIG